jgi:hypothetical protein
VRGHFVATGYCFPHFVQKPLGILYHQPIRNAQQPDPRSSQVVFFRRVLPHLAGLRVSTTVKFDSQAMLEAIEIDNPVFDSVLAPELCTQLAVAQEIPRRSFGLGLVVPKFANALGWDAHGASIAGLGERAGSLVQSARPLTRPAPADENAGSGTPSPQGRGHVSNLGSKLLGSFFDLPCRSFQIRT